MTAGNLMNNYAHSQTHERKKKYRIGNFNIGGLILLLVFVF